MKDKQTEALKMARQFIYDVTHDEGCITGLNSGAYQWMLDKIDEALDQPAQEPVSENDITKALDFLDALPNGYSFEPIDQERFERYVAILSKQIEWLQGMCAEYAERAVKDGEQKIKDAQAIKKLFTHPAPSEPFIGGSVCPSCGNHSLFKTDKSEWCVTHKCLWQSDYPPSWQGLSDDEIKSFGKDFFDIDICLTGNLMNFARAIEQALKEKNHG